MSSSRRTFLRQSAAAVTAATLSNSLAASVAGAAGTRRSVAPSDQLNVGLIGAKGMGWSDLQSILKVPGVNCIGIADVDRNVLVERTAGVKKLKGNEPTNYDDYRRLLDNKDIDAVIVGTPDHWHCLAMVDALSAGKHVYVEKPIARTIEECYVMTAATKRYGKMVQVGQWQRSGLHYGRAIDYVKSGKLGRIRLVKVWAYQGWLGSIPAKPDAPVPAGVNYDMWQGPAPRHPFNPNRFHFSFRWFWDYAGGLMTDWGVHEIDIALFAMGATAPKSVVASGGKFAYPDDAAETPDTMQTVFEYDGFNMLWEHGNGIDGGPYGRSEGIAFIGNNGTLVVNRNGWEIIPETTTVDGVRKYKVEAIPMQNNSDENLDRHTANFVEAIKKNDASILKCGIETGSVAAINASMGNISYRTGRKVFWDSTKNEFKNDSEANALTKARYQNGYTLPKV